MGGGISISNAFVLSLFVDTLIRRAGRLIINSLISQYMYFQTFLVTTR